MVKLYYGNEPYYLSAEKKKILSQKSIDAGIYNSWEEAKEMVNVLPVSASRRTVVLELEKLTAEESLLTYLKDPAEFTDLFIFTGNADQNSRVYKLIKTKYGQMQCNKLPAQLLKKWILKQLANYGAAITQEAYELFLRRISYFDDPDCSLYTVKNLIFQMAFYHNQITEDIVKEAVPETLNEKIFALNTCLFSGNYASVFRLSQALLESQEQPIAMLSAMLRAFRLAYKAALFPEIRGKELDSMLGAPHYQYSGASKYPMPVLQECIFAILNAVNGIKAGSPARAVFVTALGNLCEIIQSG